MFVRRNCRLNVVASPAACLLSRCLDLRCRRVACSGNHPFGRFYVSPPPHFNCCAVTDLSPECIQRGVSRRSLRLMRGIRNFFCCVGFGFLVKATVGCFFVWGFPGPTCKASPTFFFVKRCPTVLNSSYPRKPISTVGLARLKFRRASSEVRNNCSRFQAGGLLVKTMGRLFDVG